jgi:hypothetical protein
MKTYGGEAAYLHIFSFSKLDGEQSVSLLDRFTSLDMKLGTPHNLAKRGGCYKSNLGCSPDNPVTIHV